MYKQFRVSISLVRLLFVTLYLNLGLKSALQYTMSHRGVQVGYRYPELIFILLIFFDNVDFQVIKFNIFHECIFCKSCSGMSLKVFYGGIQPNGFGEIKLIAAFIQRVKYFMGAGFRRNIFDGGIL